MFGYARNRVWAGLLALLPLHVSAAQPATWIADDADQARYADVSALPVKAPLRTLPYGISLPVDTVIQSADNAQAPVFPLDVALPPDTRTVAVWYKGPARTVLRFNFSGPEGAFSLREGQAQGVDDTHRPKSRYALAKLGDWTLREVRLAPPPEGVVLESVAVEGNRSGRSAISAPRVTAQAPSSEAGWVWKLKDFIPSKPSSIAWTAVDFYEFGWDKPAFLRPAAWKQLLPSREIESVGVVLRSPEGKPVWAARVEGGALRKPLALPRLPEGSYFLELTGHARDRHIVETGRMVYQVLRDDSGGAMPEEPVQAMSVANPVLPVDGPRALALNLGGVVGIGTALPAVSWTVRDRNLKEVHTGKAELKGGQDKVALPLPPLSPAAYSVEARLLDSEGRTVEILDQAMAIQAPPVEKAPGVAPVKAGDQPVYSLSLMGTHHDPLLMPRLPVETFPELVRWTAGAGMTPGFFIKWEELEPLQGCYQWDVADEVIGLARASGMRSWVGVAFTGDTVPEWLWFEELMDQEQRTIREGYHYISPFGPHFTQAQRTLLKDFIGHYRSHPDVEGFIIFAGPSEGFLTDTADSISDYSPAARQAFRAFLQKRYSGDLAALNKAWGQSFASWDKVRTPLPDWAQPWETDPAWWDFHQFKADFVVQRMTELTQLARAADPERPMMAYGKEGFGSTGRLARVFAASNFRYTNGGGETQASYVQTCIMRNHGVASNPEGHYVMPNIGSVAMVIANSIWAGHFEGQNIQWGMVWTKTPHVGVEEYAEVAKLTSRLAKHQDELNATRPIQPWAGYFDGLQSMLQSRSFRTNLYPEATQLMDVAGMRLHNLPSWVDDGSDLKAMKAYRLLVDSGSRVLEQSSVATLLDYVRGGGTLVASTETGRYVAGEKDPAHALARGLGAQEVEPVDETTHRDADGMLAIRGLDKVTWGEDVQATVLKKDGDGTPMLWSVGYGQGRVLLTAGAVDWNGSASWLGEVIGAASVEEAPYRIDGSRLTTRPLRGPGADYLPFILWTTDRGLNHSVEELKKLPQRPVTVSGIPPQVREVTELLSGRKLPVTNGRVQASFMPGLIHILKIPRTE